MTMQISAPLAATDRAFLQIHAHSAKMQSVIDAAKMRLDIPYKAANQLRLPTVDIPQSLVNTIASAKALSDLYSRLNQPALKLSNRLRDQIRETQNRLNHFQAITSSVLAEQRRFEKAVVLATRPIRPSTLAAPGRWPDLPDWYPGSDFPLPAPVVRTVSKAFLIVNHARRRLADRRARDADQRHRIELIVHLPNGEYIRVVKITAKEDGLIQVIGEDIERCLRERFIAPESIQYEIVTIKLPPPGATLKVVK